MGATWAEGVGGSAGGRPKGEGEVEVGEVGDSSTVESGRGRTSSVDARDRTMLFLSREKQGAVEVGVRGHEAWPDEVAIKAAELGRTGRLGEPLDSAVLGLSSTTSRHAR